MATFNPDTGNEMFQLAIQLVNQSNRNIFLTGKAGTGKTTFLKYIRENCPKQMVVVAPTGVAAINAGGVTIHSFFQLPLAPFIPETKGTGFPAPGQEVSNKHSLLSRLRFNSDKRKVLQEMEILVIDEISMVRCDTLDAIDTVLRHIRQRPAEKFGGVQVIFIGDMLQLPPVIKEEEWRLLSSYYKGQYFFDSKVIEEDPPVYIEFNKIYRQRDENFITVLNQVRNNQLDEEGLAILESRFLPDFRRSKQDGYIILTTHNIKAAEINSKELTGLSGPIFSYEAKVLDEFSDRSYPAEQTLYLKVGAQVMFIRNDAAEKGKRYFNGKIGVVSKLEADKIFVQCDDMEIEVSKETWENIRYTMNKSTRQLESDVLGSFTQYPLRLAWAITIHKSQGLTFEKAIIDAGAAFAPGQVYVALSRCTSLEGLVLQSQIRTGSLFGDRRIVEFSQRSISSGQLQEELAIAKRQYLQTILLQTFDFAIATGSTNELMEYLSEHSSSFRPESFSWTVELREKLNKLQETATKFQARLLFLFQQNIAVARNEQLQERVSAAATYFIPEINVLIQLLRQSPVVTDSRLHSKECNDALRDLFVQLSMKKFMLEGATTGFDPGTFVHRKQQFSAPSLSINTYAGSPDKKTQSPRPVLHQQLRRLRDNICSRKDQPIYMVASSSSIDEMAIYLPQTLDDLKKISGFGDAKVKQYGQQFLDIIIAYCEEHDLETSIQDKTPKKERKEKKVTGKKKVDTYSESLRLYKEGKAIAVIAKERGLAINTIEGHLEKFVRSGDISINELVGSEKFLLIESALKSYDGVSITPVKQTLGDGISFGEIRLVMAGLGIGPTPNGSK